MAAIGMTGEVHAFTSHRRPRGNPPHRTSDSIRASILQEKFASGARYVVGVDSILLHSCSAQFFATGKRNLPTGSE